MMRQLFAAMRPERPVEKFRPGCESGERRSGFRIQHPKRVQVILEDAVRPTGRPEIILGLMKNFSAEGCSLFVQGGIAADTLWIRVFGRDPSEEFIECRVVWTGDAPPEEMKPCGVQFERTLSREEFQARLADRTHAIPA